MKRARFGAYVLYRHGPYSATAVNPIGFVAAPALIWLWQ